MKSGFVTIIGRPNSGKSTLLNTLVNDHIAITSNKAGTTRNNIKGIYHGDDLQIIFIDTPGIHKPQDGMSKYLNKEAYDSTDDNDIILLIVDASEKLGNGDRYVINKLENVSKPVILVLNKIDKLNKEQLFNKILQYKDLYNFSDIVPVSALKNNNTKELIKVISKYLQDDIKYYGEEHITEQSLEFRISELIREKVFRLTEQEVPYACAVRINFLEFGKNIVIDADVIVDRESLKKILIGKSGSMIKNIGMKAREDIEKLFTKKVFLDLKVKVMPKWREDPKLVMQLGNYHNE